MSAKERLNRLEKLVRIADKLVRLIGEEFDATARQVEAIEASISEGQQRCENFEQMVTWDGRQPDALLKDGKTWRRPKTTDLGLWVRVANSLGTNPEILPEAKLIGIGWDASKDRKYFKCEGSKGQSVEWPIAWIESKGTEIVGDEDGKGHVSIQVDGLKIGKKPPFPDMKAKFDSMAKVTKAHPSLDGPRFKIGDRVMVRKPSDGECKAPPYCWLKGMDPFDGFEDVVDGMDGSHFRGWFYSLKNVHDWRFLEDYLEPAPAKVAPEQPDPLLDGLISDINGQWRQMHRDETIQFGDVFWRSSDQAYHRANFTLGMTVEKAKERGNLCGENWVFYRELKVQG